MDHFFSTLEKWVIRYIIVVVITLIFLNVIRSAS